MVRRSPKDYDWDKCEFDETILPASWGRYTSPRRNKIEFIGIHHMTVIGTGNGAANDACYSIWRNRPASAHYGVDGDYVRQFVWDRDAAYSLANSPANHKSINIEHANSTRGPSWKVSEETMETGARLVAHLHVLYKLGRPKSDAEGKTGTMRQHDAFYATACPGPWLGGSQWNRYVGMAQAEYERIQSTPTPTPPPEPGVAEMVMGFANLRMGYSYNKSWTPAVEAESVKQFLKMRCSIYGVVEAHEENNMVDRWFSHFPDQFELAKGSSRADGNGLVFDAKKFRLLAHHTDNLGPSKSQRNATRFNLQHLESGVKFWTPITHFTAGNPLARQGQAKIFYDKVKNLHRAVIMGDFNNYSYAPGTPMQQAKNAGWVDAPLVADKLVDMDKWSSHHGNKPGKNVDHIIIRDKSELVRVLEMRMYQVPPHISDHNWLSARVRIRG